MIVNFLKRKFICKPPILRIIVGLLIPIALLLSCSSKHTEGEITKTFFTVDTITVASFNIQDFGPRKRENPDIMRILKDIVQQFDIVAIQEVSDVTEQTIPTFIDLINDQEERYNYVISERLGRSNQKEQYAYIYNTNTVELIGSPFVYEDSNDIFEREPFVASFKAGNFDFTLVNIHTKPTSAEIEIQALEDVIAYIESMSDEKDIIVLGDFNADCSYFDENINTGLRASNYYWIVSDDADTTTKLTTTCTYDRIVIRSDYTLEDYANNWGVFDFKTPYGLSQEQTESVSDHYPVFADFFTDIDTN